MAHAATHRYIKPSPLLPAPRQVRPGMPESSGAALFLLLTFVSLVGVAAGAITLIGH